jgi:[acyl-carrier-protein] S-malonyltransferase
MSRRIAIVFPGQGSQVVGMGADLAKAEPLARELFDRASEIVGYDLFAIMTGGPEASLQETRVSQPAIFVTNVALAMCVGDAMQPVVAAGHSFGEFCALTIAGAMTFEEALRLVQKRATAMGRAADAMPGTMSAVLGLDAARLREVVEEVRKEPGVRVRLANFKSPTQIVVSGDRRGVEQVGELAVKAGAKRVVPLNVSGAWHSELMEPAREEFRPAIEAADIRMPIIPVVSNVDAKVYTDVATIRHHLIQSVTDEVLWHDTSLELLKFDPDFVVEFGASRVLAPLMGRLPNAPEVKHVGTASGVENLRTMLLETA